MTTSKEHNDFPEINPKEMEIYDLPDKEFKTLVLRKLSKLQENTERYFNKKRVVRNNT